MKKLVTVGLLLCAVSVMADSIKVMPNFGPYNVGNGGEYTVLPDFSVSGYVSGVTSDLVQKGTFQTFCVEKRETISAGDTYDVDPPNTVTVKTGKTLNLATAWLYWRFANGSLAALGYNYAPAGRLSSAAALQNDLWYLMGWGGNPGDFANAAMLHFGKDESGEPIWKTENDGKYPVGILNLWSTGQKGGRIDRQDVLVLTGVPDGGLTLALLSMGLASLGCLARRNRR